MKKEAAIIIAIIAGIALITGGVIIAFNAATKQEEETLKPVSEPAAVYDKHNTPLKNEKLGISMFYNASIFTDESEPDSDTIMLRAKEHTTPKGKKLPIYFTIYKAEGNVEETYWDIYYNKYNYETKWQYPYDEKDDKIPISIYTDYLRGNELEAFNPETGEYIIYYIFIFDDSKKSSLVIEQHDYRYDTQYSINFHMSHTFHDMRKSIVSEKITPVNEY